MLGYYVYEGIVSLSLL